MPEEALDPFRYPANEAVLALIGEQFRQLYGSQRGSPEADTAQAWLREHKHVVMSSILWIQDDRLDLRRYKPNVGQQKMQAAADRQTAAGLPIRLILLKARQFGGSTKTAADFTFDALTTHGLNCRVVAHKDDSLKRLFEMYERFYRYLPEEFKPQLGSGNRKSQSIKFATPLESSIEVMLPNESGGDQVGASGRSMTIHDLHLSEFGHVTNAGGMMRSLRPCVPNEMFTKIIKESSAGPYGNEFHKDWEQAYGDKKGGYEAVFVAWWEEPKYAIEFGSPMAANMGFDGPDKRDEFMRNLHQAEQDEFGEEAELVELYGCTAEQMLWRRFKLMEARGDKIWFKREYPANPEEAFQGAGGNYISAPRVIFHLNRAEAPRIIGDFDMEERGAGLQRLEDAVDKPGEGFVQVWQPPRPHAEYVIGVDPSHNLPNSGDFGAAVVWQRLPEEYVARLRGDSWRKPDSDDFCDQLYALGRYYNDARILVERNGIGQRVIDDLLSPHRFYTQYPSLLLESDIFPQMGRSDGRFGLNSTANVRRVMVDHLRQVVESGDVVLPDATFLRECQALQTVDRHGKVAAPQKGVPRGDGDPEQGYYDDLALAAAIGYWAHKVLPLPRSEQENRRRAERIGRQRVSTQVLPPHLRHSGTGGMNYDDLGV
tara:strand:- start:1096 stop:3060 length:1965 start_codon:yes stop_codon:yes gene_type:complete